MKCHGTASSDLPTFGTRKRCPDSGTVGRNPGPQSPDCGLGSKLEKLKKDAHNSSIPPSKAYKANKAASPPRGVRRQASIGRAGGGRPLHPDPNQTVIARVKVCPHCSQEVSLEAQKLHAVYDKIDIPPVHPIVTRVRQYGGAVCPVWRVLCGPSAGRSGTRQSLRRVSGELSYLPALHPCNQLPALVGAVAPGVWGCYQ